MVHSPEVAALHCKAEDGSAVSGTSGIVSSAHEALHAAHILLVLSHVRRHDQVLNYLQNIIPAGVVRRNRGIG